MFPIKIESTMERMSMPGRGSGTRLVTFPAACGGVKNSFSARACSLACIEFNQVYFPAVNRLIYLPAYWPSPVTADAVESIRPSAESAKSTLT